MCNSSLSLVAFDGFHTSALSCLPHGIKAPNGFKSDVRLLLCVVPSDKVSTRAYRSRFDKWGIHKYSRRRRESSASPSRRNSTACSDMQRSPRQTPDIDDSSSQAATPLTTPNELFSAGICGTTSGLSLRRYGRHWLTGGRSRADRVVPQFPLPHSVGLPIHTDHTDHTVAQPSRCA